MSPKHQLRNSQLPAQVLSMSNFDEKFIEGQRLSLHEYMGRLLCVADPEHVAFLDSSLEYSEHVLSGELKKLTELRHLQPIQSSLRTLKRITEGSTLHSAKPSSLQSSARAGSPGASPGGRLRLDTAASAVSGLGLEEANGSFSPPPPAGDIQSALQAAVHALGSHCASLHSCNEDLAGQFSTYPRVTKDIQEQLQEAQAQYCAALQAAKGEVDALLEESSGLGEVAAGPCPYAGVAQGTGQLEPEQRTRKGCH